jgi:hypothetical protein
VFHPFEKKAGATERFARGESVPGHNNASRSRIDVVQAIRTIITPGLISPSAIVSTGDTLSIKRNF